MKRIWEWWKRRREPRRRTTYISRGPIPFRAEHRVGRPELKGGIGSETRPLYLHEMEAHKRRLDQARKLDVTESSQEP